MATGITVEIKGPLFDGRAKGAFLRMADQCAYDVAAQAYADTMHHLDVNIKHPTPYYETQVTINKVSLDSYLVHDRGIVYGPWLEGVSFRNQTTRFKGYHAFRKATADAFAKAEKICQRVVDMTLRSLR